MTPPPLLPDERTAPPRLRVALVEDLEVVVVGFAAILAPYAEQIEVALTGVFRGGADESAAGADIVLYDPQGREAQAPEHLAHLLADPLLGHVVIYSHRPAEALVDHALAAGVAGFIAKDTPATELVIKLQRIARGERVRDRSDALAPTAPALAEAYGLTARESEVAELASRGRRNAEIAQELFITIDTVKTHLARSFRKLNVSNRTELAAKLRNP